MFTDEEIKELLVEARSKKASAQLNIGDFCWFRNEDYDEEDLSGDSSPFFVAKVQDIDEENDMVTLILDSSKYP